MKSFSYPVLALLFVTFLSGCHMTHVRSQQATPVGAAHSDRQWFTIGGLVPLSGEAGEECTSGIAHSESGMGALDILIAIGLGVAGGAVGAVACDDDAEPAAYASCVSGAATLVPLIISSRSVEYTCAGSGAQ